MEIPLTQGYIAIIDDEDWPLVEHYCWRVHSSRGWIYAASGRRPRIFMHHLILPRRPGLLTDHRDGNGLNNRRDNLRYATQAQNLANSSYAGKQLGAASPYKGVYARDDRWRAVCGHKHVGYFKTPEEAARAYDAAARARYGEFAVLNFPEVP